MKRPKILDKFLNSPNNELEGLVTHARQLQQLQNIYQQEVPSNMAKNCQVANLKDQVLTLCCQSSAWATRGKMDKHQLLTILTKTDAFSHLGNIEFITQPKSQHIENKREIQKISMSDDSAEIISDMANSVADTDLSAALHRLARHKND